MNQINTHKYVLVGGGSGGHLTPLVPVAEEIKKLDSRAFIIHIGQKGDPLNSITNQESVFDQTVQVSAGKFRRYHGEHWLRRLVDIRTFYFNVRDLFRFLVGIVQSFRLLRRLKPDIIFTKGGYVCAPVGLAAGILGIPYITHDSDAMVSLAHRLIAKKASLHLTAMPAEMYVPKYELIKTKQVGVPVRKEFHFVDNKSKQQARKKLGYEQNHHIVLVVGGGLGARNINEAVVSQSASLLKDKSLNIIHISGNKLFDETIKEYAAVIDSEKQKQVNCIAFTDEIYVYSAAADVVITRAGATNMAELAAQAKACIVIPSPVLAGGHQLKNADALKRSSAALVLQESELENLENEVRKLLNSEDQRKELEKRLHELSNNSAAQTIAGFLVDAADTKRI